MKNLSRQLGICIEKNKGRLPGYCETKTVEYNNNKYCITMILYNKSEIMFVYDHEEYEKVGNKTWHVSSGKYIGTNFISESGNIKEIFLHNLIMDNLKYTESEKKYVIHINKNYLDNRKENLKLVTNNELQLSKTKKRRNIILPEDCGIALDDIPKYVSYVKPYGKHGDHFYIDIPCINFFWKSSCSIKIPLLEKLSKTKEALEKIYKEYPYLDPNKDNDLVEKLNKEYNDIIKLYDSV
jgi:hypothetical protein